MAASRRLLRMVLRARFHLIVLATRAVIIPVHATRPTRPVGEYNPLRVGGPFSRILDKRAHASAFA